MLNIPFFALSAQQEISSSTILKSHAGAPQATPLAPLCMLSCQAPLSMGFSRQEYWRGLPFPPPGDLPHPGTEPASPALAGGFLTTEPPGKPLLTPLLPPSKIQSTSEPLQLRCLNHLTLKPIYFYLAELLVWPLANK